MTLVITHSTVTGAVADTTALVDGPKWDANHTLTGVIAPSQGGTGIVNNDASTITISGSFGTSFTVTATTSLTLPTTGTLATLAGIETLSNKTLVAPALGTPVSGVATNLTGTAAGLTAGNVTTNANLTGAVTSVGNAASLGSFTSANLSTALTDETGSGSAVFGTSPILSTVDARGVWTAGATWTIPAVTLGGTVSGGGNQINNVVIGTVTPLAITGTTITATGNISAGGSVNAVGTSGYKLDGNFVLRVNTSVYNLLTAPDNSQGIALGSASDPTIYYDRTTHKFRAADNFTIFTIIDTNGVATAGNLVSSSATAGVGYATGAGGTVTQATSRTTGVTINKACGAITLFSQINTAISQATAQSFTVTNSAVAATDVIVVNQKSGTDKYEIFVTNVANGSFQITNYAVAGTTNEAPVFNFALLNAVTS